jgi:hypothetical protein
MGEINRVFVHIDAYIDSGGGEHLDILSEVIREEIKGAKRGYVDRDMENEELVKQIDAADERLKALGKLPPENPDKLKTEFKEAAIDAMTCRRSVLPLNHPEKAHKTLDPRKTLFDDEDQYSFAIYDTLADKIAKLLPALQQIACEVAWESDDDVGLG